MTNPYDMPILTSRQVWHHITYNPSGEFLREHVDSSPVRRFPGYEKGAAAILHKMETDPSRYHLWVFGELCWSAAVEASDERRKRYTDQTTEFLQFRTSFLKKPDEWKDKAHKLAEYAVKTVRHRNPTDMSSSRPELYTKTYLASVVGIHEKHFQRDAGEQWDYLTGELESWAGQALKPLAKWIEQKKDGME